MARSESRLVDVFRTKNTKTEKGMITNSTSLDACVDMFFMAGATRHWDKEKRQNLFQKALTENPLVAMKLLFWARDVRSGAGERDFFRDGMELLNDMYPDYLHINAHLISEFGRWDDLFTIDSDISIPLVRKGLEDGDALVAKWLPRKKQYNNFAKKVRDSLGLSPKEYRKMIVEMSNTIEQKMCAKKFEEIDYQGIPSIAMNKYRTSFYRNDEDRFKKYIDDVTSGEAKINAGVIYPHMLYRALNKGGRADKGTFKINENKAIEAQWNALPNFMKDSEHRIMPLVDVSPSMTWNQGLPLEVAISLGINISERNESIFKDAFMTFSENPTMEFLKGSFAERAYQLRYAKWGGTTNIEKAFITLLDKSVEYGVEEKYMPTMILIISDMQFDSCIKVNSTAIETIKEKYEDAGYQLPQIVFWNVRAEIENVPAQDNEKGVGLISGFSPSILKDILKGEINRKPTPQETMMMVVDSGRYDAVLV